MFAPGDQLSIAKRSPLFDDVFFSIYNSFAFEDGKWSESDAVALVALAIMTAFFLRSVLFDSYGFEKADKAFDAEDDDEVSDAAFDEAQSNLPVALLPKLVNIILPVHQIFNFADDLPDVIDLIRPVCRSFRAAFGSLVGKSRAVAQSHVTACVHAFVKAKIKTGAFTIDTEPINMQSMNEYFKGSPAVIAIRSSDRLDRSAVAAASCHRPP